jgi:hypothetical protein
MRVADDLTVSQNRTPHRKTGHRQRWIEGKIRNVKANPGGAQGETETLGRYSLQERKPTGKNGRAEKSNLH